MNPPTLQLESGVGLNDPTEHHSAPMRIENDNPLVSIDAGYYSQTFFIAGVLLAKEVFASLTQYICEPLGE